MYAQCVCIYHLIHLSLAPCEIQAKLMLSSSQVSDFEFLNLRAERKFLCLALLSRTVCVNSVM